MSIKSSLYYDERLYYITVSWLSGFRNDNERVLMIRSTIDTEAIGRLSLEIWSNEIIYFKKVKK